MLTFSITQFNTINGIVIIAACSYMHYYTFAELMNAAKLLLTAVVLNMCIETIEMLATIHTLLYNYA